MKKNNFKNSIQEDNKVVIISGVTSFLGSNLAKFLVDNKYEVYGIVRKDSKNISRINSIIDNNHIIYIDFDKDDKTVYNDILANYNNLKNSNTIFLHLAWDSSSALGRNDEKLQEKNYYSSINALYLSKLISAKKFIFTSSQAEDNDTYYGIYKKKFSTYGRDNIDNFIHLRIFSIYGENDYHNTLINYLVSCIKNKSFAEVGKCEQMWNYLYIDDFVKMIRCFIDKDVDSRLIYDIASDDNRILKDYLMYFVNNYNLDIKFGKRLGVDEKFSVPNIANTKKVIGNDFVFTKFMSKYKI